MKLIQVSPLLTRWLQAIIREKILERVDWNIFNIKKAFFSIQLCQFISSTYRDEYDMNVFVCITNKQPLLTIVYKKIYTRIYTTYIIAILKLIYRITDINYSLL